ncbi:MAG: redoxin domain-containing protein, partial [Planctomycetes bacterium]|nr:redoxin domain-containing protein [Planctomycetota bacterium]
MKSLFLVAILACSLSPVSCGPAGSPEPVDAQAPTASTAAQDAIPVRIGPVQEGASDHGLGEIIEDFRFKPLHGEPTRLSTWAQARPFVIVTRDLECPISKKYGPLTGRLDHEYSRQGVPFLYINPTLVDEHAAMDEDRSRYGLEGTYVPDKDMAIARLLQVTSSTEVFVFNRDRRMVFRGAIDDRHGFGITLSDARQHFLVDAIEAVLAGRNPEIGATTAPGCFLDLTPVQASESPIAFHDTIEPIIQRKCQRCHREGGNAPFNLTSYDDFVARKGMVKYTVRNRIMPPWFADPEVGGPWIDDMRLEPAEREALLSWFDDGLPEGNPDDAPPPLEPITTWAIGTPDAIFQVNETLSLPAEGEIPYQYCLIETNFPEDKWISKVEVRSEVPEALHHILVFEYLPTMEQTSPRSLAGLALDGYFAIQSPGVEPIVYPPDRAKRLRKGGKLFFQVHYTPIGRPFEDRPKIAFTFAEKAPKYPVLCNAASSRHILIAPGAPNHAVTAEYTFSTKARILGFNPHMHARGKSFEMELLLPDGKVEPVLRVSNWDFNWQQAYRLVEPIDVEPGTRIRATAWYDNSADNPANPDPTATVLFGLRTIDEMMIGYF